MPVFAFANNLNVKQNNETLKTFASTIFLLIFLYYKDLLIIVVIFY